MNVTADIVNHNKCYFLIPLQLIGAAVDASIVTHYIFYIKRQGLLFNQTCSKWRPDNGFRNEINN